MSCGFIKPNWKSVDVHPPFETTTSHYTESILIWLITKLWYRKNLSIVNFIYVVKKDMEVSVSNAVQSLIFPGSILCMYIRMSGGCCGNKMSLLRITPFPASQKLWAQPKKNWIFCQCCEELKKRRLNQLSLSLVRIKDHWNSTRKYQNNMWNI